MEGRQPFIVAVAIVAVLFLACGGALVVMSRKGDDGKPGVVNSEAESLCAKLQSKDDGERHAAQERLVKMGRPAVPTVAKLLKSDDRAVVERALSILRRIGRDAAEAVPAIDEAAAAGRITSSQADYAKQYILPAGKS